MRRATMLGGGGGAHSVVDAAVCHGCGHPVRLHNNTFGCVRGECECSLSRDEISGQTAAPAAAPVPPEAPSPRSLDLLDPLCRCGHRRGRHAVLGTGLPCQRCDCRKFTTEEVHDAPNPAPPAAAPAAPAAFLAPAPAAPATAPRNVDEAPRHADAPLKTPRRQQKPRPAAQPAPAAAAVVGEQGDADEAAAVAAAAVTPVDLTELAAVATSPAAAALEDDLAVLVERVLERAYYYTARWYCPTCVSWPVSPGACVVCQTPLQPIYLATIPREVAP